jgi:hypothetical protein
MVESIRVKAEGFVFSVKKRIALSDFIPHLKLFQESLFTMQIWPQERYGDLIG